VILNVPGTLWVWDVLFCACHAVERSDRGSAYRNTLQLLLCSFVSLFALGFLRALRFTGSGSGRVLNRVAGRDCSRPAL
jgi:hypothetical protein